MTDQILRLPRVLEKTGMGRTWVYAAVKAGRFPKSLKLGARAVGWRSSDIENWIASRENGAT